MKLMRKMRFKLHNINLYSKMFYKSNILFFLIKGGLT